MKVVVMYMFSVPRAKAAPTGHPKQQAEDEVMSSAGSAS